MSINKEAFEEHRSTGPSSANFDWSEQIARAEGLSQREWEVFMLLGAGLSNRTMADALQVTERTVKAHVGEILAKLEVESRLQAGLAAYAYSNMYKGTIHTPGLLK